MKPEMNTIKSIQKRISQIKEELSCLSEFKIGSLSKQWNVCGNPKCKCKDKSNPQKHGPYNKLSYTWKGISKTEFIKEEHLDEVNSKLSLYKDFRKLTDEWVDACLEISRIQKEIFDKSQKK